MLTAVSAESEKEEAEEEGREGEGREGGTAGTSQSMRSDFLFSYNNEYESGTKEQFTVLPSLLAPLFPLQLPSPEV